jgi:hypothetical protein
VTHWKEPGFYAYGTIDEENRWVISADDEAGHVDVRVGLDGYQLDLWATLPGLFSEEENDFRRRAMERLARMSIPAVRQGFLARIRRPGGMRRKVARRHVFATSCPSPRPTRLERSLASVYQNSNSSSTSSLLR